MKLILTFYIKSVCYCLYYEHVGVKRAAKIIETGPEVVIKNPEVTKRMRFPKR